MLKENSRVVSKRKRNITNRRLGYRVQYALSHLLVNPQDRNGPRHFVGCWIIKGHKGHLEFVNLFDIPFFRDQTAAYRQLKSSALTYWIVGQKFS